MSLERYAIGNLLDSIDYCDPCSRNRQVTSMQRLADQHYGARVLRALLFSTVAIAAVTTVLALCMGAPT